MANTADAANTTNAANAANITDQDSWELTWTEVRHCLLNNRLMKDHIEVQALAWWGGRVQHHFAGHLHGDHQEVGAVEGPSMNGFWARRSL